MAGLRCGAIPTLLDPRGGRPVSTCEQARRETYQEMLDQARRLGANGIIAMRYDATEIMTGLTEVLCYGTAVVVEPHGA